jgi:hypothetical protein
MAFEGLPDFQQPIEAGTYQIYFPFGGGDQMKVTPDGLQVAILPDGSPDFWLALVRGTNPMLPPEPYGQLELRLQAHYALDEALSITRERQSGKGSQQVLVDPISFVGGFLRLRVFGNLSSGSATQESGSTGDNTSVTVTTPPDMLQPIELGWNGLGMARVVMRLTQNSASMVKGALEGDVLAVKALAEMEISGVSPRLPVQIQFDPAKLLEALCSLDGSQPSVSRQSIVDFFHRNTAGLPLRINGELSEAQLDDFARAMTDRVRMRFSKMIPSPDDDGIPYLELVAPSSIGSGTFLWDLSEAFQALRPVVLTLNPLDAARAIVQAQGLDAVVHQITVPTLPTGVLPVTIIANLPSQRVGILALGATLHAPPRMPWRPQASIVSVQLEPPEDKSEARLRLSPVEPPAYSYSTFVVMNDSVGVQQIDMPEEPHSGSYLYLNIDNFPVDFTPVRASSDLLALANLHGVLHIPDNANSENHPSREVVFDLDSNHPEAALAMPKGSIGATLEIIASQKANALDGSLIGAAATSASPRTIHLGPQPAAPLRLGLHSFKEYGPHTVHITCAFSDGVDFAAFDLLPEWCPETVDNITVLTFQPARPTRDWSYLAPNPFAAGFRYRPHPDTAETLLPWSAPSSPFEELNLTVL